MGSPHVGHGGSNILPLLCSSLFGTLQEEEISKGAMLKEKEAKGEPSKCMKIITSICTVCWDDPSHSIA